MMFVEGLVERGAVFTRNTASSAPPSRGDHVAMTRGDVAEGAQRPADAFQRRERFGQLRDHRVGGIELVGRDGAPWIAGCRSS